MVIHVRQLRSVFKCPECGTEDSYINQIAKYSKNERAKSFPKEARIGECKGIVDNLSACTFVWDIDKNRSVYI